MDSWDRPGLGLFILRVATGSIFLLHGWMKLFGQEISFVQEMLRMAGWSISDPLMWLVSVLEVVGGLALVAGILTRSAALVLAVQMIVAVGLFHVRQGFFIVAVPNAPLAYGFEFHVALVGGLLCLGLSGPGSWALATKLRRNARPGE